ncbi:ATP-dependent protease LonB [Bacillaceae bacterium S4-13-58]
MSLVHIVLAVQLLFGIVIGLYFWNLLKGQRSQKITIQKESKKELDHLAKMNSISLSVPLSERVRPAHFEDVIGQEDGIKSLRAALCSENPQHVIVYGPPGVGKTAAARLVLEEAKKSEGTPFRSDAVFIELDGTTARFDERGIADPLIGSVHDPIYQGSGAMGQAGIPQPKPGAVSNAHGGVLFIDEIGELHPIQMNKLLKVLEDRRVYYESAYYSEENDQIPLHIHEIFKKGLPADFRLIGATTRKPEEIPPAIRSRCLEVFFKELEEDEIKLVARRAAKKIQHDISQEAEELIARYATNGREAVNLVQIAAGVIANQDKNQITSEEMEWVVESSQLTPRMVSKVPEKSRVGIVNGLAVYGPNMGALLPVEVRVLPTRSENGKVTITGIVEEEEIGSQQKSIRRKSMARGSVDNVLTMLQSLGVPTHHYDIHINFPGGVPVDGPSAGVTMAAGIMSAIYKKKVKCKVALTGEVSVYGYVKPVGGIPSKVRAAQKAGAEMVIIPKDNNQALLSNISDISVKFVEQFHEIIPLLFEGSPSISDLLHPHVHEVEEDKRPFSSSM